MNRAWPVFRAPRIRIGFTLIEVLVVVAIIALLVAVLIPSLAMARESARGAVCLSNISQCLKSTTMMILEGTSSTRTVRPQKTDGLAVFRPDEDIVHRQVAMKKERISTNFGWAVFSLKMTKGETGIFTCPNDPDPKPIPGLLNVVPAGLGGRGGTSSTDAIFNRWRRQGGDLWQADIQHLADTTMFGQDAADNNGSDIDCLFEYSVTKGTTSARVELKSYDSGFVGPQPSQVLDYKGRTIWPDAGAAVGQSTIAPILWMSYGANAAAGKRSVKGNPILLIESGKPGVFPLAAGGYPADTDVNGMVSGKPLRFRHGGKNPNPILKGADYTQGAYVSGTIPDTRYEARDRITAGFYDGHGEKMQFPKVLIKGTTALWAGTGKGTEVGYD